MQVTAKLMLSPSIAGPMKLLRGQSLAEISGTIPLCPCRCPALHTMVLFVASLAHAKFLEIFLLQCHDKLSSLQVLLFSRMHRKTLHAVLLRDLRMAAGFQYPPSSRSISYLMWGC